MVNCTTTTASATATQWISPASLMEAQQAVRFSAGGHTGGVSAHIVGLGLLHKSLGLGLATGQQEVDGKARAVAAPEGPPRSL